MKLQGLTVALLFSAFASAAGAQDVDEQTRRCQMEKSSLTNPSHQEGPECLKLRAMLNMPQPPTVNIINSNDGFAVNQRNGRPCVVSNGSAYCQ